MRLMPEDRYQKVLLFLYLLFLVVSCIKPPEVEYLAMQHVPTLLAVFLLAYLSNRLTISRLSYTLIIIFLCMHTVGARYLYSFVPYDVWSEYLLGINLTKTFGFDRNHYDRVVHFSYGLLLVIPVQELERRYLRLTLLMSSLLAIEFIIATSTCYELLEWSVAIFLAPDWSESFNGQQGDIFDAQKDTLLATAGAVLSIMGLALTRIRQSKPESQASQESEP